MGTVILNWFTQLAKWLDRAVPGKRARTAMVAVFVILANILLGLAGQLKPEQVSQHVVDTIQALLSSVLGAGLIFAAKHDPKAEAPLPPSAP